HGLKNIIDNRLRLTRSQPGYIHFPRDMPERALKELTGEEKIKGKWVRKGSQETFDLAVYIEALRQRIKPDRVPDWDAPPVWAAPILMSDPLPLATPSAPKPARRSYRSKGISWRD